MLDTKWKLLNNAQRKEKYGLRQSGFYQMYAYGQTYRGGYGDIWLVYPQREAF